MEFFRSLLEASIDTSVDAARRGRAPHDRIQQLHNVGFLGMGERPTASRAAKFSLADEREGRVAGPSGGLF